MFRRRWSGLPKDPEFTSNLEELGLVTSICPTLEGANMSSYFINDEDEIRNIEEPQYYFKYHLIRQLTRVEAIRDIVHARLENEGMTKVLLPLGTPATSPHVPIFASANLASASRVIIILGEPSQDLGNMALRVINGPGGINKGSMVSIVRQIRHQASSASDPSPPGIILANAGELWWWPEGGKGLSPVSANAVPMMSMVHHGRAQNPKLHSIPKNESPLAHARYVLDEVIPALVPVTARLDIIGIGLSADNITKALDNPAIFTTLGCRINTLSLLGSSTNASELSHEPFKDFLQRRARSYIADEAASLTPLAKPGGNPNTASFTQHGCTVFASGEVYCIERMLITSGALFLAWLEEVAMAGPEYCHPEVVPVDPPVPTAEEWAAATSGFDAAWARMPEIAKPSIGYATSRDVQEHCKILEDLQLDMQTQVEGQHETDD
nr:mitochondrial 40s ribosomal protein mrp2 [Colletotrichum truncatum]KAF6786196.1 mitochondrial 40s ribosomal protein mrp2 [Colletotrichum truncatum]